MINVADMTVPFIERMRKRQEKRRAQETGEPIPPRVIRVPRIKTNRGYLLNERGEADHYVDYNKGYNPAYDPNKKIERIQAMTQKLDADPPPWIFSQAMLDYYQDVPTLEPIENSHD